MFMDFDGREHRNFPIDRPNTEYKQAGYLAVVGGTRIDGAYASSIFLAKLGGDICIFLRIFLISRSRRSVLWGLEKRLY